MARGEPNDSSWITTYSGLPFWPLEPRVEDVRIEDIAHALSNVCRWSGHVKKFYSVANHCYLISFLVPEEFALEGLLHDASEAYLSDLSRPIKHNKGLGEIYKEVEYRLEEVIAKKFGLIFPYPKEVKQADSRMLLTEKADLMNGNWEELCALGETQPYVIKIEPVLPEEMEKLFIGRYNEIRNWRVQGR